VAHVIYFGNPVFHLISTPMLQPPDWVLSGCSINVSLALSKLGSELSICCS